MQQKNRGLLVFLHMQTYLAPARTGLSLPGPADVRVQSAGPAIDSLVAGL
jgi:hypothetical protein